MPEGVLVVLLVAGWSLTKKVEVGGCYGKPSRNRQTSRRQRLCTHFAHM